MALNGYFYGTTDNPRVKPKITWAATQNAAENYSDITVALTYSRTNTGYTTAGTWEGEIRIGDQVFTGKKHISVTYESNTEALCATARVYHDAYGHLTLAISAAGSIDGTSVTETAISGQAELDTIAQVSAVSAANAPIGSCATIVIARKNESFTHSLSYQFGALQGFINREGNPTAAEQRFTDATVNFLLPEAFYGEIPDSATGQCSIFCRTYNGSRLVGESFCRFTVSVDPTLCAPEITEFTVGDINGRTVALTGSSQILVRYGSTVRCRAAAQGKMGARILSMQVNGKELQDGERIFLQSAEESYTLVVRDSRGLQTGAVWTPGLIPYAELTCQAQAQRTDPTADSALLTLKGRCWQGDFGAAENTLTVECQVGEGSPQLLTPTISGNLYQVQLTVFGVSYTQSYPVTLTVSDGVRTITKNLTIGKGIPVFDWGEQEFRFHVPVVLEQLFVGEQTLEEYIRAVAQEVREDV